MNRRILLQVTAPALLIGLLLLGACIGGAWSSYRLQKNLDLIRTESVKSLEAAQNLQIYLQQLRFHSFRYLIDPTPDNLETINADEKRFNENLDFAKRSARTDEERSLVREIDSGYRQYESEMTEFRDEMLRTHKAVDFRSLDVGHPLRHIVEPCQKLLNLSTEQMNKTFRDSDDVGRQARLALLFLGLGGPLGGILCGYGIARGLSRSIYNLSVRVQDISQRLDRDLAAVNVAADGDLVHLDKQLQVVVQRVKEVAERAQRHQHEMLRAEQLSAVGQLAASVAHEVRNPLTSVKLLVEAALRVSNRRQLSDDDLRVIHGEVCRLENTVQSFLDFARLPTPCRSVADLREVVKQAIELIRARARQQGVTVVAHYGDAPVWADVDTGQISTVLVNLLLNALDAMAQGGTVTIDLETLRDTEVRLSISDTGAGIPEAMMNRLFTPFASSKATGTGLGLSISRRIIEEHGGKITAANRPVGGAAFTIIMPGVRSYSAAKAELAGAARPGENHAQVVGH